MGFVLKKTEVLLLKTAEDLHKTALKLKSYGGTESEREDSARRKRKIKQKILGGEMTVFRWCVGNVKANGLTRRVNGQHSSEVFLDLTQEEWATVHFPITVVWEEYDCDELIDLAILFEQFDAVWSNRDAKDIMGAHLGIHEELRVAINRQVAVKVAAGLVWYRQAVEGQKLTSEAKYQLIHENGKHPEVRQFLTWCGSFLQMKKTTEMLFVPVIAAMFHTTRESSNSAENPAQAFWKRVAGGKAPLDADTVEYKLAEFLELCEDKETEWPRPIAKHFRGRSAKPSDLDILATCLNAFSAYRKGRKVAEIFISAKGKKAREIADEFLHLSQAA